MWIWKKTKLRGKTRNLRTGSTPPCGNRRRIIDIAGRADYHLPSTKWRTRGIARRKTPNFPYDITKQDVAPDLKLWAVYSRKPISSPSPCPFHWFADAGFENPLQGPDEDPPKTRPVYIHPNTRSRRFSLQAKPSEVIAHFGGRGRNCSQPEGQCIKHSVLL